MPSYENAKADGEELREAERGLAYAARNINQPEDTYDVLGSINHALIGLHQAVQQLAAWHAANAPRATTDDGDRIHGGAAAQTVTDRLTAAARLIDRASDEVAEAWSANGRVVWQPLSAPLVVPDIDHQEQLHAALAARRSHLASPDTFRTSDHPPDRGISL